MNRDPFLTKKYAITKIHSLSDTSKMPGKSFGINSDLCKTGGKLAKVEGTICSDCYANKGFYKLYPAVKQSQDKRLEKYLEDPQAWVMAMTVMLGGETWFRWFDSGDLQSVQMLRDIVQVVRNTPTCNHWLATRETGVVKEFLAGDEIPSNMVIRMSATKYDVLPTNNLTPWSSGAHTGSAPEGSVGCPAPSQGGKCGSCRSCWDREVKVVSYHKH